MTPASDHLTASLEDYIEAIAELIAVEGHAHTKGIAEKLQVKMPSVTGALRHLAQFGYIVYSTHQPVQLTPAGEAVARRVIEHHRLLTRFLAELFGVPDDRASTLACRLEHLVDGELIERFRLLTGALTERRDTEAFRNFWSEMLELRSHEASLRWRILAQLQPGESAVVRLCGRNLAGRALPLTAGDRVTLESSSSDRGPLFFACGGRTVEVTREAAENIWCDAGDEASPTR